MLNHSFNYTTEWSEWRQSGGNLCSLFVPMVMLSFFQGLSKILVFDEKDEDHMLLKALAKLANGPWVKIVWSNSGLFIVCSSLFEITRDRETILKMQNILAGLIVQANKGTYDIISEHMVMTGVTHPYVSLTSLCPHGTLQSNSRHGGDAL